MIIRQAVSCVRFEKSATRLSAGWQSLDLPQRRCQSTIGPSLAPTQIKEFLSKPAWSVSSLVEEDTTKTPAEAITQKQLHHLLRLSALPLPQSPEQEAKMIKTLQSQLHFVQAIQSVDTTGVEPLQALRDETQEARKSNEYTLESLKEELDSEESVGFAKRIRKKSGISSKPEEGLVDVLKMAPNKVGRFVVVNTKNS